MIFFGPALQKASRRRGAVAIGDRAETMIVPATQGTLPGRVRDQAGKVELHVLAGIRLAQSLAVYNRPSSPGARA